MQASTMWLTATRSAPSALGGARRMASSSSPGHKRGKKVFGRRLQDYKEKDQHHAEGGAFHASLFEALDMTKSFPLFRGEGGVIESNKFYIHPNAAKCGEWGLEWKGRAAADAQWAKDTFTTKMRSAAGMASSGMGMSSAGRTHSFQGKLPPAVAEALRVGYIGPRFKQLGVPGTRPGEASVIELEGTIYIVGK